MLGRRDAPYVTIGPPETKVAKEPKVTKDAKVHEGTKVTKPWYVARDFSPATGGSWERSRTVGGIA